ncbi:MAG TPA: PAS domain-containing protein [Candidatus Limnocylindria bacterium]|nr:PAS domain-containing protein [Candidatus Limnocylindria bacterium]
MTEPVRPPDAEQVLARVASIVTHGSLDEAFARALPWLAELTRARAAMLFLFDKDELVGRHAHPDPPEAGTDLEQHLLGLAHEAARKGTPVSAPSGSANELLARALPLTERGRVLGVLCLALPGADQERDPAGERLAANVVPLLAKRLHHERDSARAAASSAQYDHWFKMLDKQIRILERERQKFSAVVNQSNLLVFVADTTGIIRWVNRAMASRVPAGEGESTWVGRSARDLHALLRGVTAAASDPADPVARALATAGAVHEEMAVANETGTRQLYLTALPIRSAEGGVQEVMVQIQDLTDLQALRRSESRYRMLFERSHSAIVMADPATHRIVLANPSASRMTGFPSDELLGKSFADLHPRHESLPLLAEVASRSTGAHFGNCEWEFRTREGEERLAAVAAGRFDLDGESVVMLELRDITERRRAERALASTEERLRTVTVNAPIILFAVDREGTITLSEGRGLDAMGLTPGANVGKSAFEIYREEPEVVENLRRALAGEEFTAVTHFGSLAFETLYQPIRDPHGEITGLIGVATDMTDRRRLEENLRQSQKMEAIGRLAGGIAHDFNNLLTAIMGQTQLLALRIPKGDAMQSNVVEIQQASTRGAALTRQLLAFARGGPPTTQVLDLNVVVADVCEGLRRILGEDVEISVATAEAPAWVAADRRHLEQVIINLAANSRDAMPQGGRLRLSVQTLEGANRDHGAPVATSPRVRLVADDSGCGMDEKTRRRLFEPFFSTKSKGSGFGLSVVYGIVHQLGGEIDVESAPGEGTRMTIALPVATAPAVPAPPAREPVPRSATAPGRRHGDQGTVLLVEDEMAVRAPIFESLRREGYDVLEAASADAALDLFFLYREHIDLVVTDVVMPKMSGGELVQRLRKGRPGLRVIYMSGYNEDAIVRAGVRDDGDLFLQKPFALGTLTARVRELLGQPPHGAQAERTAA